MSSTEEYLLELITFCHIVLSKVLNDHFCMNIVVGIKYTI
jgi:hypothetical protein